MAITTIVRLKPSKTSITINVSQKKYTIIASTTDYDTM